MRYSKHSSLILLIFITRKYNDKFEFICIIRIFKQFEMKITWCCCLIRASFSFFEIDSKKRVKTFVLTLRKFDWYMILKLYSKKILAQRVWRRVKFLFVIKIFKTLWSLNIFIEISINFNSKRQCFKHRIMINSFLS